MATEFDFPNLAPYQAVAAQRALEISRINPIEEAIKRSRENAVARDEALSRQLAAEIQRATLEKLQRPQVFQGSNSIFVEDPTATGGWRTMSGPPTRPVVTPVTYRYEAREDGTYAIPSNDPFNAFPVLRAGSGAGLPGRPPAAVKTARPKWHYETREDGTYGISEEDPTQAVRVRLKDGTPDPAGIGIIDATQTDTGTDFLPGKPRATGKSAKLSEDEKKILLGGVSQSKIIPDLVEEFKVLEKAGLAGPVAGRVEASKAALGYGSTEFTQAQAKVKGNLFKLARALQGAGVLTDTDLLRMQDIAPPLTVQEAQFVGGMRGVAELIVDNLDSFVEINSGRMDKQTLDSVNSRRNELREFIKPSKAPGAAAPANQEAVEWLRLNPNDPRAPAVRQKLGL